MHRKELTLTASEQRALQHLRDHADKPYLRERASALLKIAAGQAPYVVAQSGLLSERDPHTVYDWLARYVAEGLAGLTIKPGRGRKAAFFPSHRRGRPGRS